MPSADITPEPQTVSDAPVDAGDRSGPHGPAPHLVMLVNNAVTGDSRVLKGAESAALAGYRVTIVGRRTRTALAMGHHGDALIYRATLEPRFHDAVSLVDAYHSRGSVTLALPQGEARTLTLESFSKGRRGRRGRRVRARFASRSTASPSAWPLAVDYQVTFLAALLDLEPDLIHCHDYHPMAAAAEYAARRAHEGRPVPWVYDAHEWLPGQVLNNHDAHRAWLGVEASHIRKADAVVTVIDEIAEKLQRRHHLPERPTVVRNAPLARFVAMDPTCRRPLREECGLPDHTPLLVYVGGLTAARGVLTMVESLQHLPEVHLAFVSPSGSRFISHITETASAVGAADRVHVLPYVPAESVSWYVSSASLGLSALVPSSSHDAAVPTKLREYLHARIPVVVSDLPAQGSFVRAYGFGESFTPGDAESLARAVRTVLADRDVYRHRVTEDVIAENSWEREADHLVALWSRLHPPRQLLSTHRTSSVRSEAGAHPAGRSLALQTDEQSRRDIAAAWRGSRGATVTLEGGPPASLEQALRRWRTLERHADAVLIPAGTLLLGGYLPNGSSGEVATLRAAGVRPGLDCGSRALLSSAELSDLVVGHPASVWPDDRRAHYDRQTRRLRQALRETPAPAFTTSWLTAQALDHAHWAPCLVPVADEPPTWAGDRLRIMILPGLRSQAESEALDRLDELLSSNHVDILRPRGRGFDPSAAANADVVIAELTSADTTPAVAWALGAGNLVVGSSLMTSIGVPVLEAGPSRIGDLVREVLTAPDQTEVLGLRRQGLEYARTFHREASVRTIERILFPTPILGAPPDRLNPGRGNLRD